MLHKAILTASVLFTLVQCGAKEEVTQAKSDLSNEELKVKEARKSYESHQEVLDDFTRQLGDLFTRKNSAAIAYQVGLEESGVGGKCYQQESEPGCDFQLPQLKAQLEDAALNEKDVMQTIETQRKVVRESEGELREAIEAKKSAQSTLAMAESKVDDDLELDAIEDGTDGITGGVGSFEFDMSDFELDDVGSRRTPEQVEQLQAKLLEDTKNRRDMIRAWYAKQRQAALKGVYSPAQMKEIRARHAQRIKLARAEIDKYKKAVVARYEEYRALYKSRQINQDQWDKVQEWRQANIEKANKKFSSYRKKVRDNYERVRTRNEDRQENRRRKLDSARENALKAIRDVERQYRKKEDKLKQSMSRKSDDFFNEDLFNDRLFDDGI